MRLAVLASHEGTTLQSVIDACEAGDLHAEVCLVISNNSTSGALRRAAEQNIPTAHISGKTHPDEGEDAAMERTLCAHEADYVLLLGYMKKLGTGVIQRFQGRIINTHPALLPKFGGQGFFGRKVHEAVLDAGETVTGATIHLVELDYDTGPTLAQVKVPVRQRDSVTELERRVKAAEQKLLINTLSELANQAKVSNY